MTGLSFIDVTARTTADPHEVQLRADARRNRQRLLAAAHVEFAAEGLEAGMSKIAERAGVGVGTLYRHFPTKEALVEALVAEHFDRIADEIAAAVDEEPDPWHAFARVLRFFAEVKAEDQCLKQVYEGGFTPGPDLVVRQRRTFADLVELMRTAQEAGLVRPDLEPGDLPLVISALASAVWLRGERGGELSERFLTIILDGMRAPGSTPLPHRALSKRELESLFRSPRETLSARRARTATR